MEKSEDAKAGTLDPSFGINGRVTIDFPGPNDHTRYIRQVVTQGAGSERKIYFAGETTVFTSGSSYFVGRLNDDGTPDNTFGDNGMVWGEFPLNSNMSVKSLAIQADCKVILQAHSTHHELFARFGRDGKIDLNFGSGGYTAVELEPRTESNAPIEDKEQRRTSGNASLSSIEILPDGKILACSLFSWLIRLTAKGLLDKTFNTMGYVRVVHPEYLADHMRLYNVLSQPNGKYIGCGVIIDKRNQSFFVRVDETGALDSSFGSSANGFSVVKAPIEKAAIRIDFMARQPNQRILGVGATYQMPYENGVMTSIESNGKPNIQFNRGEPLYTNLEDWSATVWLGAAVQTDGKIVVSGMVEDGALGEAQVVVARYINETLDLSFGDGRGWITTALPAPRGGYATSIALQEDQKIVVSTVLLGVEGGIILRYLP